MRRYVIALILIVAATRCGEPSANRADGARLIVTRINFDGGVVSKCIAKLHDSQEFSHLSIVRAARHGGWFLAERDIQGGSSIVNYDRACIADLAFGANGVLRTAYSIGDLFETPDGDLVVLSDESDRITLRKLQPRGKARMVTSSDKLATFALPMVSESLQVLRRQPDGSILAGGHVNHQPLLVRYSSSTGFDASFYANVTARQFESAYPQEIVDVAVGIDRTIVAVARHSPEFFILGFRPDGSVDRTFGHDGVVQTQLTEWARLWAVAPGYLAAGLVRQDNGYAAAIERYDTRGRKDISFGENGRTIVSLPRFYPTIHAVLGGPNGSMVFAIATEGHHAISHTVLVRITAQGQLDPAFGKKGIVFDPVPDLVERTQATVTSDGHLLIVGREVRAGL